MKILVIDDSSIHQEAARQQLGAEHDLTVVGTYDEAQALLGYKASNDRSDRHDFDVVLCDLLMPASGQMQASFKLVGMEMPVGIFLALLAAKNGARYVAVLTDADHHSHPASACIDAFNSKEYAPRPTPFILGETRLMLSNWVQGVKRWDRLLRDILNPPSLSKEDGIA